MFRHLTLVCLIGLLIGVAGPAAPADEAFRRLPVKEYLDKMKGGWIGQMAGVGWGQPTEFKVKGAIISENNMPAWNPGMVNQHGNDDCYVEMTFLRTLELYGFDVSIRQAGIDFASSGYPLWHANDAGRSNLRKGIAPPDSGHPRFSKHADDIDYQIEADFSGIISPGLPNQAIALGEKFGRLMNYGDGMYAGQFIGGMYAEAYFQSDPVKLVEAGLKCVPRDSQYAEMVRDLLKWCRDSGDWEKTWQLVEDKYHKDPNYTHGLCSGPGGKGGSSIDAKLNGAYIIMGLLYGKGDLDKTIVIACRCGQDSDCNPANAGGVLFASLGASKAPARFTDKLDMTRKFSFSEYTLAKVYEVSEKLARISVERAGGRVEKDSAGEEVFVIPVQTPKPSALEKSWQPGPIADSKFTPEEMAKIVIPAKSAKGEGGQKADIKAAVEKFAPGWTVKDCGTEMDPGLRAEWGGRKNVLLTHPLNRDTGCVLSKKVDVPDGKKTALHLVVGHDPRGDFDLIVRADGKELLKTTVGKDTAKDGWLETDVDLSAFAGKTINLELVNQPTGWSWECACWAQIALESK